MTTVCFGVFTMYDWMREPMSPVVSSQKSGLSQPWCRAMASTLESGSMEGVGL